MCSLLYLCVHVYLWCICECRHTCAMACIWRPGETFQEWVLSSQRVLLVSSALMHTSGWLTHEPQGGLPISTFHLTIGVLEFQMCAIASGFCVWVIGVGFRLLGLNNPKMINLFFSTHWATTLALFKPFLQYIKMISLKKYKYTIEITMEKSTR